MPEHPSAEHLGEPALELAGLRIWIHGWASGPASGPHADNWLRVTTHCRAAGASVFAEGSILEVTDLIRFGRDAVLLLDGKANEAILDTVESNLSARIYGRDSLGHLTLQVRISHDILSQEHVFRFEIDLSYLPGLIAQCDRIEAEYPVRGRR